MRLTSVRRRTPLVAAAFAAAALVAGPAGAGNGHFIHGVGAVQSSMGGVGVALPTGTLGALYLNPAMLATVEGHEFGFSIELVDSQPVVESSVQTPFGSFTGRTENESDLAVIPSFGWARGADDGRRVTLAMGVLSLAGFGTDYPQDSTNPILLPQPLGFGGVYSSYRFMKIPFAVAWRPAPELALGVSLNAGWASLAAQPFGGTTPDCSSATRCFVPDVSEDSAFGYGLQVGAVWTPAPAWSFGAAYTSEQSFEDFSWNSRVANPDLPSFGSQREIRFGLDVPQSLAAGIGWTPSSRFRAGLDGRWIGYSDTQGFEAGFDPVTGAPRGLGWEDIVVIAFGVEYQATPRLALRGGWNRSESAVPDSSAFFNVGSPAVFEDHLTLGLGWQLAPGWSVDLGVYRAFEAEVTGTFVTPAGPVPGTRVTNEMEVDSGLATITFAM